MGLRGVIATLPPSFLSYSGVGRLAVAVLRAPLLDVPLSLFGNRTADWPVSNNEFLRSIVYNFVPGTTGPKLQGKSGG